ncbi:zinc dependent phospholipase C family protein [Nafulsella turpanensis]|uniref:zinc dependent phospholipase C family protein n=1 Tax=Nafulsella turpanensis TaxID=1265690 RepID=UPI000364607F|nr:zinc dependent phospholipase C family protein [Nafulsella turpanensis]
MQPFLYFFLFLLICSQSLAAASLPYFKTDGSTKEWLEEPDKARLGKPFPGSVDNFPAFKPWVLRSSFRGGSFSLRSVHAFSENGSLWGFYAHQLINRLAVFTLPPEMLPFYKIHIQYITENAVNPDRRRYAVEGEAERHFIDVDVYGDSAHYQMPRYWQQAVELYSEDTLRAYGIVPWHVYRMKHWLTKAFQEKDVAEILRLSADLGHYIADAHVPLHTTVNYNGQLTGQRGIHGFWESRLPEIFAGEYDFFVGKAHYLPQPQEAIWEAVVIAHEGLDSVLTLEKRLTLSFGEDKKFSFEERNGQTVRVYSREFSEAYQELLQGQVERQMRAAIRMIGSFWYTAWVDAGQPDLATLVDVKLDAATLEQLQKDKADWGFGEHVLEREEER